MRELADGLEDCMLGLFDRERFERIIVAYTAESVVLVVVFGVLDHVPPADELVAVVAVLLVCEEVCLAQELLLVMLEFSHHFGGSLVSSSSRYYNCF